MPSLSMNRGGFPVAQLSGGNVLGVLPPAFLVRITSVITATTKFNAQVLRDNGKPLEGKFKTNFFATGWKVRGVNCTNAANNGIPLDITASSLLGDITTAACATAWVAGDLVMFCTDEYSDMLDTATALAAGNEFVVRTRVTKVSIISAGLVLTGVATGGDVQLKRIAVQNDASAGTEGTDTLAVYTNDVGGAADSDPLNEMFFNPGVVLPANGFVATDIGYLVKSGKLVGIKGTNATFSGAGNVTIHLTFVRNTVGSTIAAA